MIDFEMKDHQRRFASPWRDEIRRGDDRFCILGLERRSMARRSEWLL